MMECTDRHYRYLARLLSKRTLLYTEMIKDDTLLHRKDDLDWYLGHDPVERPLALQLGGSVPETLAKAAALCVRYGGFAEVNLNCGCPSPAVAGLSGSKKKLKGKERKAYVAKATELAMRWKETAHEDEEGHGFDCNVFRQGGCSYDHN